MYSSGYRRIAREALRGKWKKMLGLLFISALLINGLNLDSLANNCFSRPEHYYFSFDVAGLGYRYTVNRVFGFGWVLMAAYALIRLLIAPAVSAGEYVQKGQIVGYVGSTGQSTGKHLHFEVYQNGTRVDPLNFV